MTATAFKLKDFFRNNLSNKSMLGKTKKMITGLEISFRDQFIAKVGQQISNYAESITFCFDKGERITELFLCENENNTKFVAFRIKTNWGHDFWPRMSVWNENITGYTPGVGSWCLVRLEDTAGVWTCWDSFYFETTLKLT